MPDREPKEATNFDIYGNAALPWSRFTFRTVFGVANAEPHGAMRWRFDALVNYT